MSWYCIRHVHAHPIVKHAWSGMHDPGQLMPSHYVNDTCDNVTVQARGGGFIMVASQECPAQTEKLPSLYAEPSFV